ncbi:hypothetical protein FJTKL_11185 [Diaporthe vaccinii]|uniref:HNH nuclease domain-containing protein n=1 Tax=Diaporthe vaccinii TaxID=105482 RepID=A0ABR4EI93_9PEZI
MTGLTASQRVVGWNVRIVLKSGIASCLGGFYQQDDFLTVGDVRRELDLCFRLDEGEYRLPALIPTGKPGVLLLLDKYDPTAFPTPPTNQQAEYYYVTHKPDCQTPRAEHSLASTCIQQTTRPPLRYDARYLPIGKACDDPLIKLVPMRGKKRPRTTSQSPCRSRSPTKGGDGDGVADDDEFPETLISKEEAAPIMSDFRQNVIGIGNSRCAVSGKGGAWWAGNGIGPAVQAAHIVPQIHWNVYPDTEQGIAPLADTSALREAWIQTWDMSNGILLAATIHQCFDARILSINPDTSRIRAFMPYDVITEYHGKKADLPRGLDIRALRHHYDMCCIENMAAQKQPGLGLSTVARNKATTMNPVTQSRPDIPGDPAEKDQVRGEERDHDATSSHDQGSAKAPERSSVDQLLSPPPSERGQKTTWRCGGVRLTDARRVQQLREDGWLVYEEEGDLTDQSSYFEDEEEERGRPRKRRCTGTNGE